MASGSVVDPTLLPREPHQERARARIRHVLEEAEALVAEGGVDAFSIPVVAERLGQPRSSIYQFFPTPYAVLNQLAVNHLQALEDRLVERARALESDNDWREVTRIMVDVVADYYRHQPAACNLLLAGPHSDSSYRAFELSVTRLGRLIRTMLSRAGLDLPAGPPDLAALAVEYGTATFRLAYFLEQRISGAYVEAAGDVMIGFLDSRLRLHPGSAKASF